MKDQEKPEKPNTKEVLDIIDKGTQLIESKAEELHKNAVLVMGITGTGKGTLINYLADKTLTTKKIGTKLVFELEQSSSSNISISHSPNTSDTFYPEILSPIGKNYIYIDCPGFEDTRGPNYEIAANFFRNKVIQRVSQFKVLLIADYEMITNRSFVSKLKETFSAIGKLFDLSNRNQFEELKQSVFLVVNKVPVSTYNENEVIKELEKKITGLEAAIEGLNKYKNSMPEIEKDIERKEQERQTHIQEKNKAIEEQQSNYEEATKANIKNELDKLINKEANGLDSQIKEILADIISHSRFAIFSNPTKEDTSPDKIERDNIIRLLETQTEFVCSKDVKFLTEVSEGLRATVMDARLDIEEKIKTEFAHKLKKAVEADMGLIIKESYDPSEIKRFKVSLENQQSVFDHNSDLESLTIGLSNLIEFNLTDVPSDVLFSESGDSLFATNNLIEEAKTLDTYFTFLSKLIGKLGYHNWYQVTGCADYIIQWHTQIEKMLQDSNLEQTDNKIILTGHFPKTSQIKFKDDTKDDFAKFLENNQKPLEASYNIVKDNATKLESFIKFLSSADKYELFSCGTYEYTDSANDSLNLMQDAFKTFLNDFTKITSNAIECIAFFENQQKFY